VSVGRYLLVVVAAALSALALSWPLFLRGLGADGRWAAVYGALLAALNSVLAYALVRWSDHRSAKAQVVAVLGGMLVRMALLLAGVVFGILGLRLPQAPLTASLFLLFAVYLAIELTIIHRRGVALPEAGS